MRVLLSGGIGDFLAIESFLTPAEREGVVAIHWATRARKALLDVVPVAFPNLREHVIERDDFGAAFTADFCISSRDELPNLPADVLDWSVGKIADEVRIGARHFTGSTFVQQRLSEPDARLRLPYVCVHPSSDNASTLERDLTGAEWFAVQQYAQRKELAIVIVNKGSHRLASQVCGAYIDDLSDQLSVLDTIEVVKRAAAFVGCASFPSVIAAKTLPRDRLFVKANSSVKRFSFWLYYAPWHTNDFVACGNDLPGMLRP